ncbi:T-cell surface antigen CD2 isoform X2 [Nelusetta ayraudi]|uniref:T-cell surface antigen CD2 isoform X2 n=1 Tax=Nelusetta ayraudi TaxID=303726 RepID=UPI003F6FEB7D
MESICCSSQLNVMKKTMAAAAAAATGLLLCFFTSASAAGNCNIHRPIGGSVILELQHTVKSGEVIKWTHSGRILIELKGQKKLHNKNNNIDILENGSLKLTNLTEAEGGSYKPDVFQDGKAVEGLKTIDLCLLDPVPKPMVNVTCGKTVVLRCDVQELPKAKYEYKWFHNGKELLKMTKKTYSPKSRDGEFHCTVHNQVSKEKSEVVTSFCSGFVFPELVFGISVWVFVGAGGGVVLLLILLILCCCIRNRRRRRMHIKDEDEYRLHLATAGQQQQPQQQQQQHQHHYHHQHQQRQPPGHTGPRNHRPKGQHGPRGQHGPKGPEPPGGHPGPSPRRQEQAPRPVANNEDPPPLPQPRKKAPKEPRA